MDGSPYPHTRRLHTTRYVVHLVSRVLHFVVFCQNDIYVVTLTKVCILT